MTLCIVDRRTRAAGGGDVPIEPLIDTETMADLIALDESAMPSLCSIVHPATGGTVNDDGSGRDDAPPAPVVTTGVRCRFTDALTSMNEALRAMRLTGVASAVLAVPLGTAITTADEIEYGGATYEIVGTDEGQSYATSLNVALRKK